MNSVPGPSAQPPAGWYPDPTDAAATRYWDGQRWTENAIHPPQPAAPKFGWYPDPTDPSQERYWDGDRWTRNTRDLVDRPEWRSGLGASAASEQSAARTDPVPTARQWDHRSMEWRELPVEEVKVKQTADGVRLGPWWRRLVGRVVDDLLIFGIVFAICFRQWGNVTRAVSEWWATTTTELAAGRPANYAALAAQITADQSTIWLVTLIITCMSATYFHHRFGATPGQLLMKLRVVPLGQGKHSGGLSLLQSIRRGAAVAIILAMTGILPLVRILDGLVALFGDRGQTTHDWLGRTQVIDARHAPAGAETADAGHQGDVSSL